MKRDRGVILVNVLVVLALGAAIVVLMFTSQETLVDRTRRAAAATQAEALVLGAEASLVAALRRDMAVAPETDHYQEDWALAAQQEVRLASGRFSVEVTDAQSRFDLNSLASGGLAQQQMWMRLAAALELPDTTTLAVMQAILRDGPVRVLGDLDGLDVAERAILAPHVSVLPQAGLLNVNTAGPTVLAAVLGSVSGATRLLKLRERKGFLTRGDLTDAGIVVMAGLGLRSDVYDVRSVAEVDGITVTLTSRILRRTALGRQDALVISRRYGAADPDDAPFDPPALSP